MYSKLPNLVIGFHGCDKHTYEDVLINQHHIKPSTNEYDWLGNGIYFWEQNLERAWQWAKEKKDIESPAVIGAVIDLGLCLNLVDSANIAMLQNEYCIFEQECQFYGKDLPQNKNIKNNTDLLLRNLDCAVIEHFHKTRKQNNLSTFDSVRGVFLEGKQIYENSGFRERTHIQICVRNPNCIKGYFSPLEQDIRFDNP